MGLGVALTGFLTGFAKRATVEIDTRNKELRERIDNRLDNYQKKVQEEYNEKIEERKLAKKRVRQLENIAGLELSNTQIATLVTNEDAYKKFYNAVVNEDGSSKPINVVKNIQKKLNFKLDKGNLDPRNPMTTNQAIDLLTEFRPTTPLPGATQTTTAFGIGSSIQERAIENFKAANPDLIPNVNLKPAIKNSVKFLNPTGKNVINMAQAKNTSGQIIGNSLEKTLSKTKIGGIEVPVFRDIKLKKSEATGTYTMENVAIRNPVTKKYYDNKAADFTIGYFKSLGLDESDPGSTIGIEMLLGVSDSLASLGANNSMLSVEKLKPVSENRYKFADIVNQVKQFKQIPIVIDGKNEVLTGENFEELYNRLQPIPEAQPKKQADTKMTMEEAEIQKWIAENLKKYKDKSPYEFNEAFKKQYPNKNLTDYLSIKK